MAQGIIYLIINKQNGHKYIGQTTQSMNRVWQEHIERSKRMSSETIHRAFRKYGVHHFMIKEVDECDESLLNEKEQYWIDKYSPEYNQFTEEEEEQESTPIIEEKKESQWGKVSFTVRGDGKHSGIRIEGMNLETGEWIEWENARMAAAELAGDPRKNSNILKAAKKGQIAYGHRWRFLEQKTKKKPIKAVNRVTWQEYHFESIADALRKVAPGNAGTGLKRALRSKGRYTWKNHLWFYL